MKSPLIISAVLFLLVAISHGQVKTGSFLLPSYWADGEYSTFSTPTESVPGAPVQTDIINSGIAQRELPVNTMTVKRFSTSAQFVQMTRSEGSSYDPEAGAVQYNIDLSSFDSYLSRNRLVASSIELALETTGGSSAYSYDVYLSYDYPPEGIELVSIDEKSPVDLYTDVFAVGNGGTVGTVAGGKFLVLAKDSEKYNLSVDLARLYSDGVKEFNLILVSASYGKNRQITVQDGGSGIFLTTGPTR